MKPTLEINNQIYTCMDIKRYKIKKKHNKTHELNLEIKATKNTINLRCRDEYVIVCYCSHDLPIGKINTEYATLTEWI